MLFGSAARDVGGDGFEPQTSKAEVCATISSREEVLLNWSKSVRQTYRWLSIVFTVGVIVNFVAVGLKKYNVWVGLSAGLPLALQLFTGLYLFVLPYASKWRSGQRTG